MPTFSFQRLINKMMLDEYLANSNTCNQITHVSTSYLRACIQFPFFTLCATFKHSIRRAYDRGDLDLCSNSDFRQLGHRAKKTDRLKLEVDAIVIVGPFLVTCFCFSCFFLISSLLLLNQRLGLNH